MLATSLGFNQVAIKQKKNICKSRLDVNIESEIIRGIKRPIPLIAANMSTVTNAEFCILLYKLGAMGIMHRALHLADLIQQTKTISCECEIVPVSVGIGNNSLELAQQLIKAGANVITIDIAHGYCDAVFNLCEKIKEFAQDVKVIVGNTVNEEMLYEADICNADAVKIGCATGLACETAYTAGCTEKQWSAIHKTKEISQKLGLPIISDGGIRLPSDFVKAIGAGANSVMAGSIFARCPESASEKVMVNGIPKVIYSGMASRAVQEKWRGKVKEGTCTEGKTIYLDLGESIENLLERYTGALRSGVTYAGGKDIESFQENCEFIRI